MNIDSKAPDPLPNYCGEEIKKLIAQMLVKNPSKRLSAQKLLGFAYLFLLFRIKKLQQA